MLIGKYFFKGGDCFYFRYWDIQELLGNSLPTILRFTIMLAKRKKYS